MTMGKHRAPEPTQEIPVGELDYDTSVYKPKKSGKVKAFLVYCQPFYKRYRKSIVAAASTAITTIFAVYTDGISQEEWMFILIQVGATLGVWRIPNATNKKVVKTND